MYFGGPQAHGHSLTVAALLECLAGADFAGFHPAAKPGYAIGGGPMGEGFRAPVPPGHALEPIVSNRRRGTHTGLDIALIDQVSLPRAVTPHTCQAIGL